LSTVTSKSDTTVTVLYALPDEQTIVDVGFEPGMTAALAVKRSGLTESYPSIGDEDLVLGIWGVQVDSWHQLKPGDRVEVSRPLKADPREMRRDFVTSGRVMGGAPVSEGGVRKKARE